jgi:hypothetical protein
MTPQFHGFINRALIEGGVPDETRVGKPIVEVVCPGCDARVGRVVDTEHGPLLYLWHNDREHFERDNLGRGPELVHLAWRFVDGRGPEDGKIVMYQGEEFRSGPGPITPEERFAERCPDCGPLEVIGADVSAGIAVYRRTGKVERVLARLSAPEV